ncbi:hypothetical protein ACOYR1_12980 [Thalassotalea piscium]
MKKLLVVLSMVLTSSAVQASNTNVKFIATDLSVESQLCVVAAESGYKAAIEKSKALGIKSEDIAFLTTCNGQRLRTFANSFNVKTAAVTTTDTQVNKLTLVKPANNSMESRLCALAAKNGVKAIKDTVKYDVRELICNGMSLSRFIKHNKSI